MSIEQKLCAGLLAQDWDETASITADWRRFGKFGRGAMYVIVHDCCILHQDQELVLKVDELWFSELRFRQPHVKVEGPIRDSILNMGQSTLFKTKPDTEGLLIELMDKEKPDGAG